MAKTFDNISEASATNYLFLFSQRTLALQNEPPTPPPLNALGLPCKGMYLLWEWVQKQQQKANIEPVAPDGIAAAATRGEGDSLWQAQQPRARASANGQVQGEGKEQRRSSLPGQ